jgi:hypothetical protein
MKRWSQIATTCTSLVFGVFVAIRLMMMKDEKLPLRLLATHLRSYGGSGGVAIE